MLTTTVLQRNPTRFTMTGQALAPTLATLDEKITRGLAKRLHRYALGRMAEAGFEMCTAWPTEVYTIDGDSLPSERSYSVRFRNERDGFIELTGILTRSGWPVLDHGFDIGHD